MTTIRELFPELARDAKSITTHREVLANGRIVHGDVVAYAVDGRLHIGELLINCGFVDAAGNATMRSVASSWELGKGVSKGGLDLTVKDNVIKFHTKDLKQAFTYRMSDDKTSCFILVPHEFLSRL